LRATVGCRYFLGGELARDLSEAAAGGVLGADSVDDIGRDDGGASKSRAGLRLRSGKLAALCEQPLQLVDRNQKRAPRHLDELDEWHDPPVEGRAADAECLGRLRARIREALDTGRVAHVNVRRLGSSDRWRRLPLRLACLALETTP